MPSVSPRRHGVDIFRQIADREGLLIHVIRCTPDISLPDRLKIRQQSAFIQQLFQIGNTAVDGTVIDQKISILCACIELLYLYVYGRTPCVGVSQILKNIVPSGKLYHFRNIIR